MYIVKLNGRLIPRIIICRDVNNSLVVRFRAYIMSLTCGGDDGPVVLWCRKII